MSIPSVRMISGRKSQKMCMRSDTAVSDHVPKTDLWHIGSKDVTTRAIYVIVIVNVTLSAQGIPVAVNMNVIVIAILMVAISSAQENTIEKVSVRFEAILSKKLKFIFAIAT